MRVLYVINGLGTGGAERSLAELLPTLARHDIHPSVAYFYRRGQGVERSVLDQGFPVHLIDTANLFARVRRLREIIASFRPDVVHTTLFEANLAGRLASFGRPVVLLNSLVNTPYASIRLKNPDIRPGKLAIIRKVDGWTARKLTDHFHAITGAVKNAAVEVLGIPPDRITVIERGRDPQRLGEPNDLRRRRARERLGLPADAEVVVNVGRQEYQKGQQYLLRAMEVLGRNRPRTVLLIAGRRGHASAELERLHSESGLGPRVRFLGHRDDAPEVLAAADVFAFPSLYEGLGGAVIEAMALGLPIVASRIPAVQEVTEEGTNALLVEAASPAELASAIENLLANPDKASAFGQRSRKVFEERFTLERSVTRHVELYRRLAPVS